MIKARKKPPLTFEIAYHEDYDCYLGKYDGRSFNYCIDARGKQHTRMGSDWLPDTDPRAQFIAAAARLLQ